MTYYISSDKQRLDIDKVHQAIKASYWGNYRSMEMTKTTIEQSMCFGVYSEMEGQLGFARVLTDHVVFAYIMDVIIFEPYQGKGLGKKLIQYILDQPEINKVHTVALKTKDAHKLYDTFGFQKVGDSDMWMAMDKAKYN
ncbi:GNAT family N-acetyltransferase [Flagellimonas algicola]|uniref:GNAT family N-acetyltransferase n=1 Tax=Flagellimonas algicola TaxID=2583815 RepID=A0ABY2WNE3_9FLAO|nr:GNAT family N-acetyltransferase [Allomuricauda algicola]TMU56408.1 GNAT family N-acetyltransferase [Allomuricauda algicola]